MLIDSGNGDGDDDDKVGYGRPPKKHRFRGGVSGNPSGRRRRRGSFFDELAHELHAHVPATENGRRVKLTKRTALIRQMVNKAIAGDTTARRDLIRLCQLGNVFRQAAEPVLELTLDDIAMYERQFAKVRAILERKEQEARLRAAKRNGSN